MHSLQINAADTLFFRDGRPFSMGEDTYAQGIFPPPPSVLYGALRTAFISANLAGEKLQILISQSENLRIHNLFLKASDGNIYAPIPYDLFVDKSGEATFPKLKDKAIASSIPTPQMLLHAQKEKPDNQARLVSLDILQKYLHQGESLVTVESVPLKDFTEKETKLGIGRNNTTRTSEEGQLYRVEMVRPAKWEQERSLSFLVELDGIDISTETWLQIGGDKKATYLVEAGMRKKIDCPTFDKNEKRFKIYLATPALFKNGWYPKELFDKYELNLIAAAVGKPFPIGGFDIKARRPKPMLRAVPAGSVYYVEAKSTDFANKAAQKIHELHTISAFDSKYHFEKTQDDKLPDSAQQGFGAVFIGKI